MGFLRNLTKSDEERRQEVLTAYLDDNLSPKDKQQFEQLLYSDESLRRDLEQQRSIKQAMAQLPRMRAPRSFTLDPSLYGKPSQQRVFNLYPAVRTATVLAMFVFIALVSIDILVPESGTFSDIASSEAMAPAVEKALEEAEAPIGALAPDGIQSNRAALSEEAAPLAPVIKEAVEEIIEVESEDAVSESEDLAQSDTGAETGLDQELAAPPEEPAAEREGEAEFMAPAEAEPGQGDSAIDQTRIADSIAALIVSGTPAPDDRLAGGAVETDGAESDDTVELLPLATSAMTKLESQVPTQPVEEVVAELPSPVVEDLAEADHFQGADSETTSDQAEELFWGFGALRIAQIILGISVLGLVLLMLFIRQRIKREA